MAVFVVNGWESGLGPVVSSYVLVSDWICFRTSSSTLGNNPSLQNHSFGGNRGKCNQACEQTSAIFSFVLMRHNLLVADCSYLSQIEASGHFLFFSYLLYLMPCWECKPNGRHFLLKYFIKALSCVKNLCLSCCMLSQYLRRSKSMSDCVALIGINFHIPVVLRVNVLFPYILLILYPFWMRKRLLPGPFSMY